LKSTLFEQGSAESGALAILPHSIDPDLASLIVAWDTLPEPIRLAIRALIQTSTVIPDDSGRRT